MRRPIGILLLIGVLSTGCQLVPTTSTPAAQYDKATLAAEQAAATTLVSSLQMASGSYMTKTGVHPNGFTDFVSIGAYSPESSYTINIAHVGDKDLSQCQVQSEVIDCRKAFDHIKPVYRWNNNQISVDFQ